MTEDHPKTAAPERGFGAMVAILVVCVAAALGAHLWFHRHVNVNWDEWNFLSKVHTFARGEPLARLQTFHVRLVWPLLIEDALPDRELREIFRLRFVSWGLLCVSTLCILQLGRRLAGSVTAGLVAAWYALTFSFVLEHGTAARYDPWALSLFLVAAVGIVEVPRVRSSRVAIALATLIGACVAVGAAVTIKMAIYAPTLVLIWIWNVASVSGRARRTLAVAAAVSGGVAIVLWRVLLAWHAADVGGAVDAPTLTGQLSSIGDMVLGNTSLGGPEQRYVRRTLRVDMAFWMVGTSGLLLGCLAVVGVGPLGRSVSRGRIVPLLAMALPVLSLAVYRNTYPYFFVTIIPPASLLVAVVVGTIECIHRVPRAVHGALVLAALLPGLWVGRTVGERGAHDGTQSQRALLTGVHAVFPEAVPYIDRCGMVASFPRVGPFMSSMSMAAYRQRGELVWPQLLQTTKPQFLVANVGSLELGTPDDSSQYRWLPEDGRILRESFVPYWGPLWIAGRTFALGIETSEVHIHIPGRYVADAVSPFVMDGTAVVPGAVLELSAGLHRASADTSMSVTLRTADAGPPPAAMPPEELFDGFTQRLSPSRKRRR